MSYLVLTLVNFDKNINIPSYQVVFEMLFCVTVLILFLIIQPSNAHSLNNKNILLL